MSKQGQGLVVIDVDGNVYVICGAEIKKMSTGYGYILNLHLINGNSTSIAYAFYRDQLKSSLNAIATCMASGAASFDMREKFVRISSRENEYTCTIGSK